jgi:hypothetical protein
MKQHAPLPASPGKVAAGRARSFSVFRTPTENLPKSVTDVLPKSLHDVDWNQAQLLQVSTLEPVAVWAVPGEENICLISKESSPFVGTICAATTKALKHGLALTLLQNSSGSARPSRLILGIAPTETRSVIIETGSSSVSVDVKNGEFIWQDEVASPPDKFTLMKPS